MYDEYLYEYGPVDNRTRGDIIIKIRIHFEKL